MPRLRLDLLLVQRGLCDSREQARRLILAGDVRCDWPGPLKPGLQVPEDLPLELRQRPRFVSRGGEKLEGALAHFGIPVAGRVAADIGASTGGFTDCLLQHGAARVHAFDVGTNQLAWKLRQDPRVLSREQFNCRQLSPADTGGLVDLVVIDVSFISLTKILPAAFSILHPGGDLICLVKPQFELTRDGIGKGGIVRDGALRLQALEKIRRFITDELNKSWRGDMESPISGTDGNREFLAWARHG